MQSEEQARKVIMRTLPGCKIKSVISLKNKYIFLVERDEPGESFMDPYFAVDQRSGLFEEVFLLTHPDRVEIIDLFAQKQGGT
jgi:hypothetical protein